MTAGPMLEVDDVVVRRGPVVAVDGLSLAVERHEIAGLVGPSGCGKTSLLRALAGFETLDAGSICIDGRVVAGRDRWIAPERRRVGMVFQEGALFPHMTVRDNVGYGVGRNDDPERRISETLDLVGLAALAHRFPDELSGGQQQLVALARALAPRPKIVLLDEPFASLDASLRQRLRSQVRSVLEAAQTTAVLVTHDQEEAMSFADRIAVMHGGRLGQFDRPEAIYHWPDSIEVAEFIGDGRLVECTATAGRLATAFGPLATDAPDGPCRLLIRPEDLHVDPSGVEGTVRSRRFHGHGAIFEVQLDHGPVVQVRVLGTNDPHVGREVRLQLRRKRFRVFVAGSESPHSAG